jgi:hypothetical protein
MVLGPTPDSHEARIDIMQSVRNPIDVGRLASPYLIRAHLTSCSQRPDAKCQHLCGAQDCPASVVWGPEDTCRVFDCSNAGASAMDTATCPPPSEPHADSCPPVKMVMGAPYQFVCVVGRQLVQGRIKCGFATATLAHGSISLDCQAGTCLASATSPPAAAADGWCEEKRDLCWTAEYMLLAVAPVAFLGLFLGCLAYKSRRSRGPFAPLLASPPSAAQAEPDDERGDALLLTADTGACSLCGPPGRR